MSRSTSRPYSARAAVGAFWREAFGLAGAPISLPAQTPRPRRLAAAALAACLLAAAPLMTAALAAAVPPAARARRRSEAPVAISAAARRPGSNAAAACAATDTAARLVSIGYDHFFNLEYAAARNCFALLTRQQPNAAAAWNHLAQDDLYAEMYRVGALASELYGHGNPFLQAKLLPLDPAATRRFEAEDGRAISLATAAAKTPDRPAAIAAGDWYDLAVAWGLRGNYDFVLRKAYMSALSDATQARRAAQRAAQLRPGWLEPQLILGVDDYVAGSLPWEVRWLADLGGYGGNKQRGIARIRRVAESQTAARSDAAVLMVVIARREGWNDRSIPWLERLGRTYPRNVLFAVELGEAQEAAGRHADALATYESVVARARAGAPGFARAPLDKVHYDLGNIERLLSRWDAALRDYRAAAAAPGAARQYRQAALLAAGQVEDARGQRAAALDCYRRCIVLNPQGPAARAARGYLDHAYRN